MNQTKHVTMETSSKTRQLPKHYSESETKHDSCFVGAGITFFFYDVDNVQASESDS